MEKYMTPYSEVHTLNNDASNSSIPTEDENEGDIIPWAGWAN